MSEGSLGRIVLAASTIAGLNAGIALVNRVSMRRLRAGASVIEPVTVCVPARDEADRLPALIADLRAQVGIPRLRVFVLDDASTDGTYEAAAAAIGADERFTLVRNDIEPSAGWTGKTAACARLAELADRSAISDLGPHPGALVFLDADVRLAPDALAAAITELRRSRAALVCPWPRQRADSPAEHLVQPLLAWSWAATLPVALANRSLRPSTAVACGQFLVFDAAAYRSIGGHAAVAAEITEDLAIARALRHAGERTTLTAAGPHASTRMYCGAEELDAGYTRWLWSAYGGPAGSAAVAGTAVLAYWVPPLAALLGRNRLRRIGLLGYAAAVTSRLLARSTESRRLTTADIVASLAHPLSIAAYLRLTLRSHRAVEAGRLTWKNRPLPAAR
ncbi:glycosyltransferase [Nocardia sp. NPDC050406]|uniref:glycosyltransferase n=1 Tax=Nocardia sp. NPDC050406 TaxID=3364318 RepID=UPI003794EB9A